MPTIQLNTLYKKANTDTLCAYECPIYKCQKQQIFRTNFLKIWKNSLTLTCNISFHTGMVLFSFSSSAHPHHCHQSHVTLFLLSVWMVEEHKAHHLPWDLHPHLTHRGTCQTGVAFSSCLQLFWLDLEVGLYFYLLLKPGRYWRQWKSFLNNHCTRNPIALTIPYNFHFILSKIDNCQLSSLSEQLWPEYTLYQEFTNFFNCPTHVVQP